MRVHNVETLGYSRTSLRDKDAADQGVHAGVIADRICFGLIAILAALLLPSLSAAKNKAQSAPCLNNVRQIGWAWQMYADDHQGHLAPNAAGSKAV